MKLKNKEIFLKSLKKTFKNFIFSILLIVVVGVLFVILNFEGWNDLEGNLGVFAFVFIPSVIVLASLIIAVFLAYFVSSFIKNRKIFLSVSLVTYILLGYLTPTILFVPSFIKYRMVGHFGWEILTIIVMFVAATLLIILNYWFMIRRLKIKNES